MAKSIKDGIVIVKNKESVGIYQNGEMILFLSRFATLLSHDMIPSIVLSALNIAHTSLMTKHDPLPAKLGDIENNDPDFAKSLAVLSR